MPNQITSLQALQSYTLRKLGDGVENVELTPEQLNDRFDDALQMYNKYHMEGYTSTYVMLHVIPGQNMYALDDSVIAVPYIIPKVNSIVSEPSFSVQWEYMNEKRWIGDIDLTGFELLMEKMKMIDIKFRLSRGFTFNQSTHVFQVFDQITETEDWALMVYKSNDPYTYCDIFNDEWLRNYYTALCMIQWGQNFVKYTNVPLPSGAVLNFTAIREEGKKDKEKLEEELVKKYQEPIDIMFG